jgi:hypothetical protein
MFLLTRISGIKSDFSRQTKYGAGSVLPSPPHAKFALFYQILHKNTPFLGEESVLMRDIKKRTFLSSPLTDAGFAALGLKPHDNTHAASGVPSAQVTVETSYRAA